MANKDKKEISEDEKNKILEKSQVKDEGWPIKYEITVNTPFQSVGKFYNMVLEEVKGFISPNIVRIGQSLDASPTSAFYQDISQRKAIAKQEFDRNMGAINNMIQTITKLIYSLREFDLILDIYKKLEKGDDKERVAAELNLRRIFIDEVDIKKGRGSINNMTVSQGMEFVGLRDNFLIIKDLKSVDDLETNDRVKRVLKDRFNEYTDWKKAYKKDYEGRRKIQKEYLRNQVESLKMTLEWVKPYYTLLQQLKIGSGEADPELLTGLDNSIIKTTIRSIIGGEKSGKLATAFTDVTFRFKTSPIQVRSEHGQAHHHVFSTTITYIPYVMTNEDYAKINQKETFKDIDFLKTMVGESLNAIKDDLEKYMSGGDIKEEEKNEKKSDGNIFTFLLMPFKALVEPITGLFKVPNKNKGVEFSTYKLNNDLKELSGRIKGSTTGAYENFKDENGYITWSATLAAE